MSALEIILFIAIFDFVFLIWAEVRSIRKRLENKP